METKELNMSIIKLLLVILLHLIMLKTSINILILQKTNLKNHLEDVIAQAMSLNRFYSCIFLLYNMINKLMVHIFQSQKLLLIKKQSGTFKTKMTNVQFMFSLPVSTLLTDHNFNTITNLTITIFTTMKRLEY